MAEPAPTSLAMGYETLLEEIGFYVGFGRDDTAWSDEQAATVAAILNRGARMFYYPPPIQDDKFGINSHQWSFLRPVATLTLVAPYSTGTIAVENGSATVTLTDGTWPSWAATNGTLVVGDYELAIASRDGDDTLTLSAAYEGEDDAETTYTLRHDGLYAMPSNYEGLAESFTYDESVTARLQTVPEGMVRQGRQNGYVSSDPVLIAVRPVASDGTSAQTFEAITYPWPSTARTVYYRYFVSPVAIDKNFDYPAGGQAYSELLLSACLAAAESTVFDRQGEKRAEFERNLVAAVLRDRALSRPEYLGSMNHTQELLDSGYRVWRTRHVNDTSP